MCSCIPRPDPPAVLTWVLMMSPRCRTPLPRAYACARCCSCTFVSGFTIAFVYGWEMAFVMIGCIPFLALIGGMLATMSAKMSSEASESYAEVR